MTSPFPLFRGVLRRCFFLLLPLAALPAQAQSTAPPVDPNAVLAALKDLKAKQTQIIGKARKDVLANLSAAQADPSRAYETAVIAVEMQGQNNDATRLMKWRKENADMLRDRNFVNGLRLQLAYISLSWQRTAGVKNKDLLAALLDYTNQVTASYDAMWSFAPLRHSLNDSVLVKYFQIGPYFNALTEWSDQPFDVDSIYQKSILPVLRDMKDRRVLDYWGTKIQAEAGKASRAGNNLSENKFNTVRRPALLWSRAEDEITIGDRDRGIADMLALATAHPDHPDFDKWTTRLTELVTPKGEVIVRDVPDPTAAPTPLPPVPAALQGVPPPPTPAGGR